MMLSLRQLEMVTALARRGHFARAAKDLRISQPALSQALRAIEDELGERLFDRGQGVFRPTMFGRIVLDHGKAVLRDMEALQRELTLAKALDAGSFTASASIFPSELWGARALSRLCQDHPRLNTRLITSDGWRCVQDVVDGIADVAVTDIEEMSEKPDLLAFPLETLRIVCFTRAAHPLARVKKVEPRHVSQYSFVGPLLPRSRSNTWFREVGMEWATEALFARSREGLMQPRICVSCFPTMLQVVRESHAIGWAPEQLLAPLIADGSMRIQPTDLPPIYSQFAMIVRRGVELAPATRRYIKIAQGLQI
jgi:DNA-binding transcriptional LysR family regulator